ncbi:hypothetical protein B0H16DRAFT_1895392 [Mycena metata]|uniref:Uncharacterized protein n=1 Tax=Mycena metata TaxID=1033252 RepID=A0AAD7HNB0_9AGAR|nr:hypothetical protein B0H16DRAFT_1895392 [Mycena metata]
MAQDTPTVARTNAAAKRGHASMLGDDHGGSDNDAEHSLSVGPALPNQNVVVAARHHANKKRLRGEQVTEVEMYLKDPSPLREAKLLIEVFALTNQLDKVVTSTPAFELSSDLEKYAHAIILSDKTNTYKGEVPKTALLEVIKRLRLGIPLGLENNPADWAKVVSFAEYALTQTRSKTKKSIRTSLRPNINKEKKTITYGADSEHQNIFQLTTAVVKGTQCSVNVRLCSRVALMRKVYLKNPKGDFWDKLDLKLQDIREKAGGDSKKVVRAFRSVLEADQAKHGHKTYKDSDMEDQTDEFQQTVDNIIDIGTMDAATSTQDQPGST